MTAKTCLLSKLSLNAIPVITRNKNIEIKIYNSIDDIHIYLTDILPVDHYWHHDFHRLIEKLKSFNAIPYYAVLKEKDKVVGFYYFQLKDFKLSDAMRLQGNTFTQKVKKSSFDMVKFQCLVSGNLLLTGKYGLGITQQLSQKSFDHLAYVIEETKKYIESNSQTKIGAILVKDFYAQPIEDMEMKSYARFQVQPNMIFYINPLWSNMEDYVDLLTSKYKKRYKRARKKIKDITAEELDLKEINKYEEDIHRLYLNVSNNASFNLFTLDRGYFFKLKKVFDKDLFLKAYFRNDEMVGFYTVLKNYNHLDAHFLGYDPQTNVDHQLYLNMLYDMIDFGIDQKMSSIIMSRTAIEIKSSVGAQPKEMYCFFKLSNSLMNNLTGNILSYYNPSEAWTPRHPFGA